MVADPNEALPTSQSFAEEFESPLPMGLGLSAADDAMSPTRASVRQIDFAEAAEGLIVLMV